MFSLQQGLGIDRRQQQQQKAWSSWHGDAGAPLPPSVRPSVACNQFCDGFIGGYSSCMDV